MDKGKGVASSRTTRRGMRQITWEEAIERGKKRKEAESGSKRKGKVNRETLDAIKADKEKLQKAYNDPLLTEEERIRKVEEVYKKYDKMEINLIERDDNYIARYVEAHEPCVEVAEDEIEKGREAEDIADGEYDEYVVNLADF